MLVQNFGGQKRCIMGDVQMMNAAFRHELLVTKSRSVLTGFDLLKNSKKSPRQSSSLMFLIKVVPYVLQGQLNMSNGCMALIKKQPTAIQPASKLFIWGSHEKSCENSTQKEMGVEGQGKTGRFSFPLPLVTLPLSHAFSCGSLPSP